MTAYSSTAHPPLPRAAASFRLALLGSTSLEREGGAPVVGRAMHRHRLALLAVLACTPGAAVNRERLLALLWPESDREKGRNLLKVAVYELRKTLGDDALLTVGDDLRLDTNIVRCDVRDLDDAAARHDHAAVVAAYGGPLLDGFHVEGAHDLDEWFANERARLANVFATALERLAERATADGDHETATGFWKRRAVLDPLDSRVAGALVRSLDLSGNPGGALQHAAVHERLLQQELGIGMPAPLAMLVARLRDAASGAPAITPQVSASAPASLPSRSPLASPVTAPATASAVRVPAARTSELVMVPDVAAPAVPSSAPRRRRWRLGASATVLLVAVVALGTWYARRPAAASAEKSVAVLPFVGIGGDSASEYFSDGVTDEIITRLAAYPALKVISRTSAMRYKGTTKSIREIAAELGVTHILEGSVRREGEQLRITAQLIDANTDAPRWAQSYDRTLVDALRVQSEIAGEVGRALEVQLRGPVRAGVGTDDPEAYTRYLQARSLWYTRTPEGHRGAITLFEQAIARDSTYADAYVGLADAWFTAFLFDVFGLRSRERDAFVRVQTAARRAYVLDSLLPGVHTTLAITHMWQNEWPDAEREFLRALELNPGYELANTWYGAFLSISGRSDEAVDRSRKAWEADPFNPLISSNYGGTLLQARRGDEAMAQARYSAQLAPGLSFAQRNLSTALTLAGQHDEAIRIMRAGVASSPEQPELRADLAYALASAGRSADARALIREALAHPAGPVSMAAFNVARAYVGLGERDSAFAWLDRADYRWPPFANLYWPSLDAIRGDPRFAALEARVRKERGLR